jgi:hypothetical protein
MTILAPSGADDLSSLIQPKFCSKRGNHRSAQASHGLVCPEKGRPSPVLSRATCRVNRECYFPEVSRSRFVEFEDGDLIFQR